LTCAEGAHDHGAYGTRTTRYAVDFGVASTTDGRGETAPASDRARRDPYHVRATDLLKIRGAWVVPVIVGSTVLLLMTLLYIGRVVNAVGHLRGLPISLVNEDLGARVGPRYVDLGAQLQSAPIGSRRVSTLLSLTPERLPAAEERMNRNGAYATVVIPRNFARSLLSLTGLHLPAGASAGKRTVVLLTKHAPAPLGSSARPAPTATTAMAAVLSDPITFSNVDCRPLPSHSIAGVARD